MAHIRIAHISDTHILRQYQNSNFFDNIKLRITPDNFLSIALEKIASMNIDVLVITGDLVHEGTNEDYIYLKEIIHTYVPNMPVYYSLGNHDIKKEFYKGMFDISSNAPYYTCNHYKGYRFISIDTSKEFHTDGYLHNEQLLMLKKELQTPSKNGSIILSHHPIQSLQNWFNIHFTNDLLQIISKTDVFLYLCGHAHYNEVRNIHGITQIIAESFAFGVEQIHEKIIYTESKGFTICDITNKQVVCHFTQLFPYKDIIHTFADVQSSLQ